MSIVNGVKIGTMVSAANGDTYGDGERNEFRTQQALIQANVKAMFQVAAPGSPSNGDTYVVGSSPTGWTPATIAPAVAVNQIAYWAVDAQDGPSITPSIATGGWEFYTPQPGWVVYDNITAAFWTYNGSTWVVYKSAGKLVVTATSPNTTLSPAVNNSFRINLPAIAITTNLVVSNGVADGQEITVEWVQGATSGSTITAFSNIHGFTTPSTGVNTVSVQRFTWDATAMVWYAVAAGSTGM